MLKMTPTGFEQNEKTRGKTSGLGFVPPYVPPCLPITPDLIELFYAWESLDESERVDLLAYVRVIQKQNSTGRNPAQNPQNKIADGC